MPEPQAPKAPPREPPIVRQTYEFLVWLLPRLGRLPRQHRHVLGTLLAKNLHRLLQGLLEARFSARRGERLSRAAGILDVIRYQVRLLVDLDLLDARRYEYCARQIAEIGRQLGAWRKHEAARGRGRPRSP